MDITAFIETLRGPLEHGLVAVDFDGTLAPIVPDPADSRPAPGAVEALRALAERGTRIAVITGRDAQTVVRLGGADSIATIPGIVVEGLYGAERWQNGTLTTLPEPDVLRRLRAELPAVVASGDPELWIEDKRLSLVVHGRKAADPEAALDTVSGAVTELGERLGLDVHPGRGVLELRLPGYDKGGTLLRLVTETKPTAVLFIGDDVGDVPAFGAATELRGAGVMAYSVAAVSAEAPEVAAAADIRVDGPAEVVALLTALSN